MTGGMSNRDEASKTEVDVFVYTEGATCSTIPALSEPLRGHSLIHIGDSLVICGGQKTSGKTDACLKLDTANNNWASHSSLTTTHRLWSSVVTFNDNPCIVGAFDASDGSEKTIECYSGGNWGKLTNSNDQIPGLGSGLGCACSTDNNELIIVGGYHAKKQVIFRNNSGTWETWTDLLNDRYGHACTILQQNKVLVAGGNVDGIYSSTALLIDLTTKGSSATSSMSSPRYLLALATVNDQVIAFGGRTSVTTATDTSEAFDATTNQWIWTSSGKKLSVGRGGMGYTVLSKCPSEL